MKKIPIMARTLLALMILSGMYTAAHAQTVGTYTEQNGNVKNAIGVTIVGSGTNSVPVAAPTDATANTNGMYVLSMNEAFDGTSWVRQRGNANGIVVQPALPTNFWKFASPSGGIVNTTTAVTVKAAAGASLRNYICTMNISHDTLGAASEFVIRDGAAGPVLFLTKLQTAANEGASEVIFNPCLMGSVNTLVEVATTTATVSGGTYVNLSGYTGN